MGTELKCLLGCVNAVIFYLAIDGEIEGAVSDDEDVVDDDEVADPLREVDVAAEALLVLLGLGEALPDLVAGDDHLAHVAQHEQHDDACKKDRWRGIIHM